MLRPCRAPTTPAKTHRQCPPTPTAYASIAPSFDSRPDSVAHGLRAVDLGDPTYEQVCAEHTAYVAALRKAAVEVTVLPALEEFADSIFVEDPL